MPFARYLLERHGMQQYRAIGRIGALTDREQQVAALAKSGLSNKGIAKSIGLSEGTVKHHLHRVFQKLGIRRRSGLQP
jgi:DNA-binding NarL/FixJ family response regulator